MDENTWRLAEFILAVAGIGISLVLGALGFIWNNLGKRFEKIDAKFDKIDQDIKELRTSLNRMEGAFYSKDCCMLKDESHDKEAK